MDHGVGACELFPSIAVGLEDRDHFLVEGPDGVQRSLAPDLKLGTFNGLKQRLEPYRIGETCQCLVYDLSELSPVVRDIACDHLVDNLIPSLYAARKLHQCRVLQRRGDSRHIQPFTLVGILALVHDGLKLR